MGKVANSTVISFNHLRRYISGFIRHKGKIPVTIIHYRAVNVAFIHSFYRTPTGKMRVKTELVNKKGRFNEGTATVTGNVQARRAGKNRTIFVEIKDRDGKADLVFPEHQKYGVVLD